MRYDEASTFPRTKESQMSPHRRTGLGWNFRVIAVSFLLSGAAIPAQAQFEGPPWPMRITAPRLVASGPLGSNPTVVRGLRNDRYHSLAVYGYVQLGEEHYGNYYKGYYADAAYRWESRARDASLPTQPPSRPGVVATNLGVALAESSYEQGHTYHTDWFLPQTDTMTIQLAVQPEWGQIYYSLVEMHPDVAPGEYRFHRVSATWHHSSELMGQPPVGMASGRPEDVRLEDLISILTGPPPAGTRRNDPAPPIASPPQVIRIDNLFSPNYGQPLGPAANGGMSPPPNPQVGTVVPPAPRPGPADVDLAPGFDGPRPSGTPGRPTPPNPPRRANPGGNSINLLDQIAPPVR
jgi:hypothetical protein